MHSRAALTELGLKKFDCVLRCTACYTVILEPHFAAEVCGRIVFMKEGMKFAENSYFLCIKLCIISTFRPPIVKTIEQEVNFSCVLALNVFAIKLRWARN